MGGLERALWRRAEVSPLRPQWIEKYGLKQQLRAFTDSYQPYSVKGYHRRELFDVGVEGRLVSSEQSARMFRLEYRYPMLDVRLVEFCYNLPSRLKIWHGIERYPIRRLLEGVTTARIQWRQKADVNHPAFAEKEAHQQDRYAQLVSAVAESDYWQCYLDPNKFSAEADEALLFTAGKTLNLINQNLC